MARQACELGGEVKLRENPPVNGDIRAGAALQGSPDSRQYICREAQLSSLHSPGHSRQLPSDVVEGEHFVIADLRRLVSSSARPSGGPVIEASSRVQGAWSASGSSTSPSEDSSSSQPVPSRRTRSSRPEWLPLPEQVAGSAPRVITIKRKGAVGRRNAPGSKGEDFIPRVSGEPEDFQDLEEEEREERMTGLLDCYAARERKRQLSSSSESGPAQATGSSQPTAEGGLEMQAIVIPGSLEPGTTDQTEPAGVARTESKEADPVPSALQVIHHSDEGRPVMSI